jgi:hypothetical protein
MTQPSTRPPEIVRRQPLNTSFAGVLADHVPDRLFRQTRTPGIPVPVDPPKQLTGRQIDRLVPSKPAGEQDRQQCAIAFALQLLKVRRIPEPVRLFRRQPIAESDADFLDALDASYTSSEVRA